MKNQPGVLVAACDCLDRAEMALIEARQHDQVNWRYVYAHMAALRVAAAVLAVCAGKGDLRGRHNAWDLLGRVAPELHEWSELFGSLAARRALASTSTTPVVTAREADDLVRAAEQFTGVAERYLGLAHAMAQ